MSGAPIFISYVREDAAAVDVLAAELRAAGLNVWLDRDSVPPGTRWKQEVRRAIAAGGGMIVCFSTAYAARNRSYMNEELTLAIEELRLRPTEQAWLYLTRLDNCDIPDRGIGAGETLRDLQVTDLFPDVSERASIFASAISARR